MGQLSLMSRSIFERCVQKADALTSMGLFSVNLSEYGGSRRGDSMEKRTPSSLALTTSSGREGR